MSRYLVRNLATQSIDSVVSTEYPADHVGVLDLTPYTAPGCELIPYTGTVDLTPLTPTSALRWDGAAPVWVETADLEAQRSRAIDAMSLACGTAITSGFVSSALGAAHTYPAKPTDQANLSGSVLASILPGAGAEWVTPFWCADAAGTWAFRAHTAAQIQQVGVDAKAAILACMNKNVALSAQIMVASAEQLKTIAWPA